MALNLPYGNTQSGNPADNGVEFIPYGAPVQSLIDNKAPRQLKANLEFIFDILMGITPQGFEVWDSTKTYEEGEVVQNDAGDLFRSLSNNNTAALSDTTKWKVLNINAGDLGTTQQLKKSQLENISNDSILNESSINYIDTTISLINLQLPDNPNDKTSIIIKDAKDNAQNNPVRVYTNSTTGENIIQSGETEIMLDVNGFMVEFLYDANDNIWYVINLGG